MWNKGRKMRIIIAEDEQRARKGLEDQILSFGEDYQVIGVASDGKKALNLIQTLNPDVVFTDVKMPFMDGIELIRICRSEGLKTEFVIVSAYAEFEFAQQAISLGVTEYLLKPLSLEDLQNILERLKTKLAGKDRYQWEKSTWLRDRYPNVHPLIRKSLDYIENNYNDRISQREIAKQLNISPEYLSYLFKKETGENFAKFLQNFRIEVAQKLLVSGNTDPDDVAYMVGFSDSKYFAKVFKESTGKSVREFLNS